MCSYIIILLHAIDFQFKKWVFICNSRSYLYQSGLSAIRESDTLPCVSKYPNDDFTKSFYVTMYQCHQTPKPINNQMPMLFKILIRAINLKISSDTLPSDTLPFARQNLVAIIHIHTRTVQVTILLLQLTMSRQTFRCTIKQLKQMKKPQFVYELQFVKQ